MAQDNETDDERLRVPLQTDLCPINAHDRTSSKERKKELNKIAAKKYRNKGKLPQLIESTHAKEVRRATANRENVRRFRDEAKKRTYPPRLLEICCRRIPRVDLNAIPLLCGDHQELSSKTLRLWNSNPPMLIPIMDCIEGPPPTDVEIIQLCNPFNRRMTSEGPPIGESGSGAMPDKTSFEVLAQAFNQGPERNPGLIICNQPLKIPKSKGRQIQLKWKIKLPCILQDTFTPISSMNFEDVSVNLSMPNSCVNFHVDNGGSGLAMLAGGEKFWALAPLLPRNAELMKVYNSQVYSDLNFSTLLKSLEGVIFVQQTTLHGLWLRGGVIHCTFTATGGLLYGPTNTIGIVEDLCEIGLSFQVCEQTCSANERSGIAEVYCLALDKSTQQLATETMKQNAVYSLDKLGMRRTIRDNAKLFASVLHLDIASESLN